jgi:hypothetical protein
MKRPHNRILEKLGGGIRVAFKAEDTRLHCFAALTFLPDDVARDACRSLMGYCSSDSHYGTGKTSGFIDAQAARSRGLPTRRRVKTPETQYELFGTGREHKLNHL